MKSDLAIPILVILLTITYSYPVAGQETGDQESAEAVPASQGDDDEIPPPETVEILTKDNVNLKCTFYPGTKEKETIPVILLHDWGGNRQDMVPYAEALQQERGCAVLIPDLRGHGESLTLEGSTEQLDRDSWKPAEIATTIRDIEACKVFLFKHNNEATSTSTG